MSRLKLLVSNVAFFGGLKVLGSLFPLLILPYITTKLNGAKEFGVYDIFLISSSLGASIAMMGIQESMFKEYHNKKDAKYRKEVTSTGFVLVLSFTLVVASLFILFKESFEALLFDNSKYYSIVFLSGLYILMRNISNVTVHPSRLRNEKSKLLIETFFNAFVFYSAVLLLINYTAGLYALIYSHLITSVFIIMYFLFKNRNDFFPICFSQKIGMQLLKIGFPLMPIFIIYWANNSVVRILIMNYLGASDLGVFAIGSKYASISTFIQIAFGTGWSFFTFSTMNDGDQAILKSKIFSVLLFLIAIIYALIAPSAPYFFNLIFTDNYIDGYVVFGQLFLAPLFLMLYQIIANQFTILGKSYYSLISLGAGFIIGVFLAFIFLENGFGIRSVSYSIPVSYLISILLASIFAKKEKVFNLDHRSIISFLFIIIVNILIQMETELFVYFYIIPFFFIYLFMNKKIIIELISLGKNMVFSRNSKNIA